MVIFKQFISGTIVFLIIITSLSTPCAGQTVRLQVGTSISRLDWKLTGINTDPLYPEKLIGYSVFAGVDYMERRYFNLSSNFGFLRKGGKTEVILVDEFGKPTGETKIDKARLDYMSLNTLIEIKYPVKDIVSPFIGIGPRADILIKYSYQFEGLSDSDELQKIAFGLIMGAGVKYDRSKMQYGLRADYYLDFTKIAEWSSDETGLSGEIMASVFTVTLSFGLKL